jgi:uncharacterized protein with beta-barrel porin domain
MISTSHVLSARPLRAWLLGCSAILPLILAAGFHAAPVKADILAENMLIGTSGGGLIFNDPDEGVLAPGIKSVTFTSTRDPLVSDVFLAPYENIIFDFSDVLADGDLTDDPLASRGEVPNCMMANNPSVFCDSASGTGKRIKTWLTGRVPFDMRIRTSPTYINTAGEAVDVSSVDYFNFGKVANFTGARIIGLRIELLAADGTPMGALDPANSVLFNLDPDVITNLGNGARLVDGLFGAGGQEGDIGFFSDLRAGFSLVRSDDTLDFGAVADLLDNPFHVTHFGTAMLDNSMIPEGLFWDDNGDPTDEAALVAWNNIAGGGWTYGNLGLEDTLPARLEELAASLGVSVADLAYTPGALMPAEIVAAAEASGVFEVAAIEDLRNANVNYTITVRRVDGNEFIIRTAPRFAPIVETSGSEAQFLTAGSLDAANVPYLGADAGYLTIIANVMALPSVAERQQALAELGFNAAAGVFGAAHALGTDQFFALSGGLGAVDATGAETSVSSKGAMWSLDGITRGFVSLGGRVTDTAATANNMGFETQSAGIWAGIERRVTPTTAIGVMLGGGQANTDMDLNAGSVDIQSLGLGVYASGTMGGHGRYKAMLGYQALSLDTERNISVLGATALGDTEGGLFVAGVEADWLQPMRTWRWGPTAALQYVNVSVDGYSETGAGLGNLTVGDLDTSYMLASAGLRAETDYQLGGGMVNAFAYTTLTTQSGGDDVIATSFSGLPGFGMPVDAQDDTWLDVGLGISTTLAQSASAVTTLGAEYKGAFFGDGFESHALRVSLNVNF